MGRLRARLATTTLDRDIQRLLADAVQKARAAQQLCAQAARGGMPRGRRSAQAIQQAIVLLDGVGLLTPGYDTSDPDLMPEEQKRPGWFRRQPQQTSPAPEPADTGSD